MTTTPLMATQSRGHGTQPQDQGLKVHYSIQKMVDSSHAASDSKGQTVVGKLTQGESSMIRIWHLAVPAVALLTLALGSELAAQQGEVVEFDGLKATAPADWRPEKPKFTIFRFKQFWLPADKTAKFRSQDKDGAELAFFKDISGGAEANIKRWKEMFDPPQGKTIEEVSKVTTIKIAGRDASYLDVAGTYKHKEFPMSPKTELRPDHRGIFVYWDGKENTYQVRLVGPTKTVDQYKEGLDAFLKALK
jgi:hypothetical protein